MGKSNSFQTIFDLSCTKAREFLLKSKCYCTIDFPSYFNFQSLLDCLSKQDELSEYFQEKIIRSIKKLENVNYNFVYNKDGKYQWRELQLINPVLYVSLVNQITKKDNWDLIKNRLKDLKTDKVICCSHPIVSKKRIKGASISNWYENYEQFVIEKSIDYEVMINTDISNCYSSIYTHSISWAIMGKQIAKQKRNYEDNISNIIDNYIQAMHNGQTNGIPQGSVLMDLIAEIVLAYADKEFEKKNIEDDLYDYLVIRYRDDYRILAKNKTEAERLLKNLSLTLYDLNLKLNESKTIINDNIILNTMKKDKLEIINNPIIVGKNVEKCLINVLMFIKNYPNSGQAIKILREINDEIKKKKAMMKNHKQIISIVIEIMLDNPSLYPSCSAILSNIFNRLNEEERDYYIKRIIDKNNKRPYADYLDVWLQRIVIKKIHKVKFESQICQKIDDSTIKLWENSWVPSNIIHNEDIIDYGCIKKLSETILDKEINPFANPYQEY